jgi:hypothetical protein
VLFLVRLLELLVHGIALCFLPGFVKMVADCAFYGSDAGAILSVHVPRFSLSGQPAPAPLLVIKLGFTATRKQQVQILKFLNTSRL